VMDVFFGFVLLVLAGAVVLLFAMLGELTARLPALGVSYRDPSVRPLEEARLGQVPSTWPAPLSQVVEATDPALLLVLSTACASCEDVAVQLADELERGGMQQTAVVVSCGDRANGEDFVERHGLRRLPCYIDEDGSWVTGAFGVQTSPTGLLIRDRRLESALLFADVAALRAAVTQPKEVA
jgi:hypothetical protein